MSSSLSASEMYAAVVERDTSFDGAFFVAVRTTGIFCRPGCGAKKPRRENVDFFPTPREALHAGFRPCLRCRPLDPAGKPPAWVSELLTVVEHSPDRRISASDLRELGVDPARAARWFRSHYGMTFTAYHRARRVGLALRHLREPLPGGITRAAMKSGFASESGFRDAFANLFGEPPRRAARNARPPLVARWMPTPIGPMIAVAADEGIALLEFVDRRALERQMRVLRQRFGCAVIPGNHPHLELLAHELEAYFAGKSLTFSVPVSAPGTPFQSEVWRVLRAIPPGETRSYADLARELRRPSAVRAVARANGDNRLALLLPCHRVIGSDGDLTGYAGGLWRKQWLLDHERATPGSAGVPPAPTRRPRRVGTERWRVDEVPP